MPVDLDPLFGDQLRDLPVGDRPEEAALLPRLDRDFQLERAQLLGGRFGIGALGAVSLFALGRCRSQFFMAPVSATTAAPCGSRKLRA